MRVATYPAVIIRTSSYGNRSQRQADYPAVLMSLLKKEL